VTDLGLGPDAAVVRRGHDPRVVVDLGSI
jgi:hypothetical protein